MSLRVPSRLADQLRPRPREVTQVLQRSGRDETAPDQPQREQIRDPRRVVLVTFRPGMFRMCMALASTRVTWPRLPHRLPVDAGRFHRHVRDLLRRQPVQQIEQATVVVATVRRS